MGVIKLPSYTSYWSTELRYPAIADIMPLKRFEKLRRYLHFVDNNTYNQAGEDRLFKVKPIVEGKLKKSSYKCINNVPQLVKVNLISILVLRGEATVSQDHARRKPFC